MNYDAERNLANGALVRLIRKYNSAHTCGSDSAQRRSSRAASFSEKFDTSTIENRERQLKWILERSDREDVDPTNCALRCDLLSVCEGVLEHIERSRERRGRGGAAAAAGCDANTAPRTAVLPAAVLPSGGVAAATQGQSSAAAVTPAKRAASGPLKSPQTKRPCDCTSSTTCKSSLLRNASASTK